MLQGLAQGAGLTIREKDPSDGVTDYWEEWEVLGYENLDFWVEYDHDTKAVTLYRPAESEAETVTPEGVTVSS